MNERIEVECSWEPDGVRCYHRPTGTSYLMSIIDFAGNPLRHEQAMKRIQQEDPTYMKMYGD